MPVIPETMRKINSFTDVKVLTNKDIYSKVGKRMPQMPKTSTIAVFSLSKVQSIAAGEDLCTTALDSEEQDIRPNATEKAIDKVGAESTDVPQQEVSAQS